jgi:DNA-binding MarR family transcriptional regulator
MDHEMPDGTPDVGDYETGLGEKTKLDLRVWLRLLTCTNLIEHEVRRRMREEFDFTLPRFDILAQLDRAPAGLTMGELSRRLMVSNGNVTGLVDRLVGEGLVERQPAPGDRRAQMVRLTADGRAAFDKLAPEHGAWIDGLFAGLDRAQLDTLFGLLGALKRSVQDSHAADGAETNERERSGDQR